MAFWPRLMLDCERWTLTHSSGWGDVLVGLGLAPVPGLELEPVLGLGLPPVPGLELEPVLGLGLPPVPELELEPVLGLVAR